jgi:hypothetical protein
MPSKRSGCGARLPQLLIIIIVATLLASGLFLAIPYLQGGPNSRAAPTNYLLRGIVFASLWTRNRKCSWCRWAAPTPARAGRSSGQLRRQLQPSSPTDGPTVPCRHCRPLSPPPTLTATARPQRGCVIFVELHRAGGRHALRHLAQVRDVYPPHGPARHLVHVAVPGAVIRVPVGDPSCCTAGWRPYVVEDGETWFGIAQTCGITLDTLLQGNGANSSTPLFMTQVICVP